MYSTIKESSLQYIIHVYETFVQSKIFNAFKQIWQLVCYIHWILKLAGSGSQVTL